MGATQPEEPAADAAAPGALNPSEQALGVLAYRVGQALIEYAHAVGGAPKRSGPRPTPAADGDAEELSPREQVVLDLPEISSEHGISSGELAKATLWKQSNADALLKRLEGKGLLEGLAGRPRRWRRPPA